ncbi:MAG: hypothetical protein FWF02_04360 [Micrococcales bacterium]|nr:hypothetical protein [Micrococcales bacterium]MCL2666924.1 hypothetical protein [Micrococcales bacterium]
MHPTARRCVWGTVVLWVAGAAIIGLAPTLYDWESDWESGWATGAWDILVGFLQDVLVPTGAALLGAAIVIQVLRGTRPSATDPDSAGPPSDTFPAVIPTGPSGMTPQVGPPAGLNPQVGPPAGLNPQVGPPAGMNPQTGPPMGVVPQVGPAVTPYGPSIGLAPRAAAMPAPLGPAPGAAAPTPGAEPWEQASRGPRSGRRRKK